MTRIERARIEIVADCLLTEPRAKQPTELSTIVEQASDSSSSEYEPKWNAYKYYYHERTFTRAKSNQTAI